MRALVRTIVRAHTPVCACVHLRVSHLCTAACGVLCVTCCGAHVNAAAIFFSIFFSYPQMQAALCWRCALSWHGDGGHGAVSTHVLALSHGTAWPSTARHATPRHTTPRHATPRHATPQLATPCQTTLHHATLRHTMHGPRRMARMTRHGTAHKAQQAWPRATRHAPRATPTHRHGRHA